MSAEFHKFRRSYLAAFLCGSASDWLKGPYIYRFYEARGFSPEEITVLFATGYVSSAFFGLVAGAVSDAWGRRRMCLVFCVLYIVHCLLHAFSSFWPLLVARAISGVATALLFSSFEAWMVDEHIRRFASFDLAETFAVQTQGNAIVAIVAGMVAQGAVLAGGYSAPFVVAVPLLAFCGSQVWRWPENVGTSRLGLCAVASSLAHSMSWTVVRVGTVQCLFEGAMHIFVLLWSPCLQRSGVAVPHGLVFSLYMVCVMVGGRLSSPRSWLRPSLGIVCLVGAGCLMVPSLTQNLFCNLAAFSVFEGCVGCYFPQIAMLRSGHLHERSRSTAISLFRIPFNCIVVAVLFWGRALPPATVLRVASAALALAAGCFHSLPPTPSAVRGDENGPARATAKGAEAAEKPGDRAADRKDR